MAPPESPLPLAVRLRQAIREAGISQRELARRIVARTDGPAAKDRRVENERRQIGKYLAGKHQPEPERADLIAELLGKPPGYFTDPDDARTRVVDQIRVVLSLLEEIRAIVQARLPEVGEPTLDLSARLRSLETNVEQMAKDTADSLTRLGAAIAQLSEQLPPKAQQTRSREGP